MKKVNKVGLACSVVVAIIFVVAAIILVKNYPLSEGVFMQEYFLLGLLIAGIIGCSYLIVSATAIDKKKKSRLLKVWKNTTFRFTKANVWHMVAFYACSFSSLVLTLGVFGYSFYEPSSLHQEGWVSELFWRICYALLAWCFLRLARICNLGATAEDVVKSFKDADASGERTRSLRKHKVLSDKILKLSNKTL